MIHNSPLVQHARGELAALGETDRRFVASLVSAVGEFAAYGHSGESEAIAGDYLARLVRWDHLAPLTSDPAEWRDVSEYSPQPRWQSRRDPRAFSTDGGKTWWFVEPRRPGERCVDGGVVGVTVRCSCCGGSGMLFQPETPPGGDPAGAPAARRLTGLDGGDEDGPEPSEGP